MSCYVMLIMLMLLLLFHVDHGNVPAAAVYCTGVGWGAGDSDWIMWLCIAFAILFGIMLLINIFLCSAMTCSCTKSEIIEKEPSIYDDYSTYESQYG